MIGSLNSRAAEASAPNFTKRQAARPGTARGRSAMGYRSIEDYGSIGGMHSVALVEMDGSTDRLCFPH